MKKGSKKSSKKSLLLVVLLLLVGVTGYFAVNSYAKYATEIKGNKGTATVAKWAFKTDNAVQTFTINLAKTYEATSLVGGKIAPGTEGAFIVNLSNANSETGVAFTMTFEDLQNIPTNLKIYKTRTGDTPGSYTYSNELDRSSADTKVTGKIAVGQALEVPLYWVWEFGENDLVADAVNTADTADGEAAKTLTIGLDIVGVQTNPKDAVTTAID